jgi:hypothetical protein
MEGIHVRFLKLSMTTAVASMLLASAALAGGAHCTSAKQASASCGAKSTAAAACGGSMANCTVEATRLRSGDLVVHYVGATPEAVAYLHAKCEGSPDKFCCPMTQKMASNESCKVDMAKVSNGVIVFVSSPKAEVVDTYAKEFAALTTPASK